MTLLSLSIGCGTWRVICMLGVSALEAGQCLDGKMLSSRSLTKSKGSVGRIAKRASKLQTPEKTKPDPASQALPYEEAVEALR